VVVTSRKSRQDRVPLRRESTWSDRTEITRQSEEKRTALRLILLSSTSYLPGFVRLTSGCEVREPSLSLESEERPSEERGASDLAVRVASRTHD